MSEGYDVSDWLEGDDERPVSRRPGTPTALKRCPSEFVVESGWNTGQTIVRCDKSASHVGHGAPRKRQHGANTHWDGASQRHRWSDGEARR